MEKIKGYNVEEYLEDVDGSIDDVELIEWLGNRYGVYWREEDEVKFIIKNFGEDDEYIWRVVEE